MKRINTQRLELWSELTARLENADAEVREAVDVVEEAVEHATSIVEEAIGKALAALERANSAREDMANVATDIATDAEEYHSERSEEWQESEAGEQYRQWVHRLEDIANTLDYEYELDDDVEVHVDLNIDLLTEDEDLILPACPDEV